jgi:hypothetical protein
MGIGVRTCSTVSNLAGGKSARRRSAATRSPNASRGGGCGKTTARAWAGCGALSIGVAGKRLAPLTSGGARLRRISTLWGSNHHAKAEAAALTQVHARCNAPCFRVQMQPAFSMRHDMKTRLLMGRRRMGSAYSGDHLLYVPVLPQRCKEFLVGTLFRFD